MFHVCVCCGKKLNKANIVTKVLESLIEKSLSFSGILFLQGYSVGYDKVRLLARIKHSNI